MRNKSAEAVRVRTWFSYLLEHSLGADVAKYAYAVAGDALGFDRPRPDLVAALEAWLNNIVDTDLGKLSHEQVAAVTRLTRSHYADGRQSPTDLTLSVFEVFIRGSREVYVVGPQSLPLWAVMEGDLKVCETYLTELLVPQPGRRKSSFGEQVQAVFDALIAPVHRLPWSRAPDIGREQQSIHPVLYTHWQAQREALHDEDQLLEVRVIDDQIVGALALWQIAMHRKEAIALHLEWLLMGLCSGVIAEHFNEPIQNCLLNLLRTHGKKMDSWILQGRSDLQPFDARWTIVIDVKSTLKKQRLDSCL